MVATDFWHKSLNYASNTCSVLVFSCRVFHGRDIKKINTPLPSWWL